MPALHEYRTRVLLQSQDVPVVEGTFFGKGAGIPSPLPLPPVYLKAQIPGATGRAASGLVRRADTQASLEAGLEELLSLERSEGVLVTGAVRPVGEHYAACILDLGAAGRPPSGVLLWSPEGGSGVEDRAGSLTRIPFSLLDPPAEEGIAPFVAGEALARVLHGMVRTFCRYRLTVLEANPVALLDDGSAVVLDCRAEFEERAVAREDAPLFSGPGASEADRTPLEKAVDAINAEDPSGTGFFRQNRESPPAGAIRVATNLCGGGGKMLWEMAAGGRDDIYTMNESDTSGGLSAFKSYRILRAILAQDGAKALVLTGSGMAFQNQHHIAAAVWKALRESATPLPSLIRFGGTDEDSARELMERVSGSLPVEVRVYPPEVFPNAMLDDLPSIALTVAPPPASPPPELEGEPFLSVEVPPGSFHFHPGLLEGDGEPAFVTACPTGFLVWNTAKGIPETRTDARCTGCLMCEAASLTEGNGEWRIRLDVPGEVR
jgi:succinyl-CoA synthetase beta subunit